MKIEVTAPAERKLVAVVNSRRSAFWVRGERGSPDTFVHAGGTHPSDYDNLEEVLSTKGNDTCVAIYEGDTISITF